jgi:hypothetical protein
MKHTLRAGIRELRQSRMEQLILFPKRLILFIDMRLRNLKRHILICDLGNIRKEENNRKTKDKDSNGEVNPLHALQGRYIIRGLGEESIRAEYGTDNGADGVEGLGEVDTDFGVAGRTADWRVLVNMMVYLGVSGFEDLRVWSLPVR